MLKRSTKRILILVLFCARCLYSCKDLIFSSIFFLLKAMTYKPHRTIQECVRICGKIVVKTYATTSRMQNVSRNVLEQYWTVNKISILTCERFFHIKTIRHIIDASRIGIDPFPLFVYNLFQLTSIIYITSSISIPPVWWIYQSHLQSIATTAAQFIMHYNFFIQQIICYWFLLRPITTYIHRKNHISALSDLVFSDLHRCLSHSFLFCFHAKHNTESE